MGKDDSLAPKSPKKKSSILPNLMVFDNKIDKHGDSNRESSNDRKYRIMIFQFSANEMDGEYVDSPDENDDQEIDVNKYSTDLWITYSIDKTDIIIENMGISPAYASTCFSYFNDHFRARGYGKVIFIVPLNIRGSLKFLLRNATYAVRNNFKISSGPDENKLYLEFIL